MALTYINPLMISGQTRGYKLFAASGTFNPADYNLKIGDLLMVWVVGGGEGGGSYSASVKGKGANSTFGSITALGGGQTNANGARGGEFGGNASGGGSGGGGGGFIPGLDEMGGDGLSYSTQYTGTGTPTGFYTVPNFIFAGLGGGSAISTQNGITAFYSTKYGGFASNNVAGGGQWYGGGGGTAAGRASAGGGGAGFGAGGGGGVVNDSSTSVYTARGGQAGEIRFDTIKLTSMTPITVSVGGGGGGSSGSNTGTTNDGKDGTTSGYGAGSTDGGGSGGYAFKPGTTNRYTTGTGGGGAGGCVFIQW